jgi:hypothetical protein
MANELVRACEYLGVKETAVLASRLNEAEGYISIVIDNGIKGCPKYTIPLDKLPDLPEPDAVKVEADAPAVILAEVAKAVLPKPKPKPKPVRKARTRKRKVTKK